LNQSAGFESVSAEFRRACRRNSRPLAHRANGFNATKAGATVFQYADDAELQGKEHSERGANEHASVPAARRRE
jgi:hypothetical protein